MHKYLIICLAFVSKVFCDLPTNCTYEDTVGTWTFVIGQTSYDNSVDCSKDFIRKSSLRVKLLFPNYVIDLDTGNLGKWTMIYNQGFEVIINKKRYFAFQKFENGKSICSSTSNGWVHDVIQDNQFQPKNWGCYYGRKDQEIVKSSKDESKNIIENIPFKPNKGFINKINQVQRLWKATSYEEYELKTRNELFQRAGGVLRKSRILPRTSAPLDKEVISSLPESIDWRNIGGVNYVSPVRNQGSCGSCYAFASMALLEANVRIASHNKLKPVFSTQDVVSCSEYSQGCAGGFPYLVAGKFAQDFGVIEEDEYPYIGNTTQCKRPKNATKTYVSDYGYIGEFYGGCHEVLMRKHLAEKGPLAVSIEVYSDLQFYKSGIYVHSGLEDKFNPWEVTNHVVLIVGYGVEAGTKYWIVKNSWGEHWGENGFFRIRRGTDEVAIESMAVYADPYVEI